MCRGNVRRPPAHPLSPHLMRIGGCFGGILTDCAIMFIWTPLASGGFAHSLAAPALSFGQSPIGDMYGLQMRAQTWSSNE